MPISNLLSCWAVTSPGLELLAAAELSALGLVPGEQEAGGVAFDATHAQLADALLWLRSVNRVTVRVAEFPARTFGELERHAGQIDWTKWLAAGSAVHFRVTSKKSRLYHQDAIAERLARSVMQSVPTATEIRAPSAAEEREANATQLPAVQRFIVRIWRDQVTLSADASGALLHRRGWRLASGKAPLRESLAAAMLLGCHWDGTTPLTDPFCGSGTIAIEAALLARRIAPGGGRRFAAETWPTQSADVMTASRARAATKTLPHSRVAITGFDRDDGAIAAARANAERAGVADDVMFERATVAMLQPDPEPGLLLTNPPYGVRVGERNDLRDLYATLGRVHREQRHAWQLAMLSADPMLAGHAGVKWEEVWRTTNGGLPVRLVKTVNSEQ